MPPDLPEFDAIARFEPRVHALIDFDEPAARRRAAAGKPGALHGWSLGVKDIIDVRGMPTRCGASFTPDAPAPASAAIVDLLESLGCFVMAKTVTTTFAYFDPGPTRNPWNMNHTPGGSSSGSAAAVACGMVRLALGTQTVGSINRPASFCGVVGFKPSYGSLPTRGMFPFSRSVDTVGYFTRDVNDMMIAFGASVPGTPENAGTFGTSGTPGSSLENSGRSPIDSSRRLSLSRGKLRVGLVEDLRVPRADDEMISALRAAAGKLHNAGHDVRAFTLPPECEDATPNHWDLVAAEAAEAHRELFDEFGPQYPTRLRELILRGQTVTRARLDEIQTHRAATAKAIERAMRGFDFLLTPAAPGAAPAGMPTGDPRFNLIWTYAGLPSLTLPAQLNDAGLPLGIQLIALRGGDTVMLVRAQAVEKALGFAAQVG